MTTAAWWMTALTTFAIGEGGPVEQPIEFIALPVVEPADPNASTNLKLASDAKNSRWPKFFRPDGWRKPNPPEPPKDPPPAKRSPFNGFFGKRDNAPSDWLLVSRCRSLLYRDPQLAQSSIYVASDEGIISLRGSVTSELLRVRAEEIAKKTDGQRGVRNDLVVMNENRPWAPQPPVALSAPGVAQPTTPDATVPPASFVPAPPALDGATAAARQVAPIPAVGGAPEQADDVVRRSAGSSEARDFALGAGVVVLGQPEVLSQRPGRPQVVSYLIRRPIDAAPGLDQDGQAVAGLRVPPTVDSLRVAKTPINPSQYSIGRAAAPKRPIIAAPEQRAEWAPVASAQDRPPIASMMTNPPIAAQSAAPASEPQAAPATPSTRRADVEDLLSRSSTAQKVRYEMRGAELILFGQVPTARALEDLTAKLGALPGVETISFENVQITP